MRQQQKRTLLSSAGKKNADDRKVIKTAEYLTSGANRQRNQAKPTRKGT
jgi:hypothetical protein